MNGTRLRYVNMGNCTIYSSVIMDEFSLTAWGLITFLSLEVKQWVNHKQLDTDFRKAVILILTTLTLGRFCKNGNIEDTKNTISQENFKELDNFSILLLLSTFL